MSQFEMFAPPAPERPAMPIADSVRPRLAAVLRQLRDGTASGWSETERRRWSVVFPQICAWLPEPERPQTRLEFSRIWGRRET